VQHEQKNNTSHLSSLLHDAGLKATLHRVAVLDVLIGAKAPLRIKDIGDRLSRRRHESDMVTIYRTIEAFRAAHVVRRLDFEEDAAYYELLDPTRDHHYMICTSCRRRLDVEGCMIGKILPEILARIPECALITRHSVEFFGLCKHCAEKEEKGKTTSLAHSKK
jgi:Fur family ferric uptake transcriptional regulator